MQTRRICRNGHTWESHARVGACNEPYPPDCCPNCGLAGEFCDEETQSGSADQAAKTMTPADLPTPTDGEIVTWPDEDHGLGEIPPFRAPVHRSAHDWVRKADSDPSSRSKLAHSTAQPPTIPGYQCFEELGQGGMGIVYRALHLKLGRYVALKMLRDGGELRPEQVERMRIEAQAVAQLADPHVVQVFEVGDIQGRPYMALELVEGRSLDVKVHHTPQSAKQAAQLTRTLAETVERVHQAGIIHRDLKPSNVLVEEDGTPKITDFGLAKFAGTDSDATRTGAILGTPNFMAPEQAAGQKHGVDQAADVYALGGILYFLLTGRPPFQADSLVETLRQVVQEEPAAPRALNAKIDRDLETICLKCLEKRKEKRYRTAGELADDLSRFLDHRPILARPTGTVERVARWCGRNPMVASLAAALVVIGLLGIAGILWQWRDAEFHRQAAEREAQLKTEQYRQAEQARAATRESLQIADRRFEMARSFVQELHQVTLESPLAKAPRNRLIRKQLMQLMLGYYRQLLDEQPQDELLPAEQANAQFKVGSILTELGNFEEARESLLQAIQTQRRLHGALPNDAQVALALADSLTALAAVEQKTGHLDRADASLREAVALIERGREDGSLKPEEMMELGVTLRMLGGVLQDREEHHAAQPILLRSRALLDQLSRSWPDAGYVWLEWVAVNNQIAAGHSIIGETAEAIDDYLESIAVCNRLLGAEPDEQSRLMLALTQQNLSHLYANNERWQSSIRIGKAATENYEQLIQANPDFPDYRNLKAGSQLVVATVLTRRRQFDEAIEVLEETLASQRELVATYPSSLEYRHRWIQTKWQLGGAYLEQGQVEDAIEWLREVRDDRLALLSLQPDSTSDQSALADEEALLGSLCVSVGNVEEGIGFVEQSIARQRLLLDANRRNGQRQGTLLQSRFALAVAHQEQGELSRAIEALQDGVSLGFDLDAEGAFEHQAVGIWLRCVDQLVTWLRTSRREKEAQSLERRAFDVGCRHLSTALDVDSSREELSEIWLRINSNAAIDKWLVGEKDEAHAMWQFGIDVLPTKYASFLTLHRDFVDANSVGVNPPSPAGLSFDRAAFQLTGKWVGELDSELASGYAVQFNSNGTFIGLLSDDAGRLIGWDQGRFEEQDGRLELFGAQSQSRIAIDPVAPDAMHYEVVDSNIPGAVGLRLLLVRAHRSGIDNR